ncbi:MAG: hypothetical protein IKD31_07380, partial [Clostridia bacterium]|nr:hypothetical protein [Clostridia bacterium]
IHLRRLLPPLRGPPPSRMEASLGHGFWQQKWAVVKIFAEMKKGSNGNEKRDRTVSASGKSIQSLFLLYSEKFLGGGGSN